MNDLKTTLPGLIAAICVAIMPLVPTNYIAYVAIINAAALGALGFFAKQAGGKNE
jgi:hypothetical protein